MNASPRWVVGLLAALGMSCGSGEDEQYAEFTYDGHCGVYATLMLWRPGLVTPTVTNATGLQCVLLEGSLPAGMHLDASTCAISGTPLAVESQSFWVRATATNVRGYADRNCWLDVHGPPSGYGSALGPNERHLPGDVVDAAAISSIWGGRWTPAAEESLVYEVASGTIHPGLSLDPATGRISGTLGWSDDWNAVAWAPFTVRYTVTGPLGVVRGEASPGVAREFLDPLDYGTALGTVGVPMTKALLPPPVEPGADTVEYALSAWGGYEARLPDGLALDAAAGEIFGTPTAVDHVWTGIVATVTRNGVAFPRNGHVVVSVVAP